MPASAADFEQLDQQTGYKPSTTAMGGAPSVSDQILGWAKGAPPAPVETPKNDLFGSGNVVSDIANTLAGSEQTFGAGLRTLVSDAPKTADDINKQDDNSKSLLLHAIHVQTDPTKKAHMLDSYNKIWGGVKPITAGDIDSAFNLTPEQIAGAAAGTALDVATAGEAPKAVSGAVKAPTVLEGALKGAKTAGALGLGYGAAQGMQENKDLGGVAVSALEGGAGGALAGGIIGGGAAKLSSMAADKTAAKLAAEAAGTTPKEVAAAEKVSQKALEAATPKVPEMGTPEYLKELRAGNITAKTATQPAQYVLKDSEQALIKKFEPLLQGGDVVKNTNNVLGEVINQDKQVGEFLAKDPQVYVKADLRKALTDKLSGITDVLVPKENMAEARQGIINTIMSKIPDKNTGRTYEDLWQFRKQLDQTLKEKMNAFSGAPSLKKDLNKGVRDAIQTFIASNTKDTVYATKMRDMSQMYDLMDMLENKAAKEKNLSGLQAWFKANPVKTKLLEGLGFGALIEGGRIIGTGNL